MDGDSGDECDTSAGFMLPLTRPHPRGWVGAEKKHRQKGDDNEGPLHMTVYLWWYPSHELSAWHASCEITLLQFIFSLTKVIAKHTPQ